MSHKSIKDFVFSMKWDSKPSMLESLFPYCYEDLKLQTIDIEIYRQFTLTFIKNIEDSNKEFLKSKSACEIPGTQDQAESDQ